VTLAISVVMPAHNEADLLELSVNEVVDGLRSRGRQFEVLVIENGSVDATAAIAASLAERIPEVMTQSFDRANYGRAMRAGLTEARGDTVVHFDVDYYDLAFVDQAVARLTAASGPAIVVGSKRARGSRDARHWSRRLVTWGFTTVLRVGFGLRVSDTHGMKASTRARIDPIARRCLFDVDLFDTELVIRAERAGLGVAEVPVSVEERRPSRTSVWGRVARALGGLVRLRIALWRERGATDAPA
jgi:glycosyltransferase involved in cell wall biosynthesis